MIKGRGDTFDRRGRLASLKGGAVSMSATGTSQITVNLSQENEELRVRLIFILEVLVLFRS